MCHAGDDDFWINARREYHRRVYTRIEGDGLIFALPALRPIVNIFDWKAFVLRPTGAYVAPNMCTISLCKRGLTICKISGLPPLTHMGSPRMCTGISL